MMNPKKLAISAALALLSSQAHATYIDTATNRAWRQLTETTALTWYQVATVCDPSSGVCNGSVGGIDFTGWNWATTAEVVQLFADLDVPSGLEIYDVSGSTWIKNMVDIDGAAGPDQGAFFATGVNSVVMGWSRESLGFDYARTPYVEDNGVQSRARIVGDNNKSSSASNIGVWLYGAVPAGETPEPAGILLFATAVAALALSRRNRAG